MFNFPVSRHQPNRLISRARGGRRWPLVEHLEERQLLSTTPYLVSNNNDSGAGSLRAAIQASNLSTGTAVNTIDFDISSGGTQTIALKSALPAITHPVVIDATTQPGTGSAPRIVLSGTGAGTGAVGLTLKVSNSTVKGLAIDSFSGDGIDISSGSDDVLTDLYVGLSPSGAKAANGKNGVTLSGTSTGNTLGGTAAGAGNVISGNLAEGISILGAVANRNVIEGNEIGTNIAGTAAIGNGLSGVFIEGGAASNSVGGTASGAGNLISGNDTHGVDLSGAIHDVVQGNLVGTNALGSGAVGNADSGVLLENDSNNNLVGGTTAAARNVLSGNLLRGVHLSGGSSDNLVEGNLIGTNAAGKAAIGNLDSGVLIDTNSDNNTIGGTTAGAANTIAGNLYGVHISNASDNLVEGNWIGTNAAGSTTLGNAVDGVLIDDGAAGNTIGGTVAGTGNTISYNLQYGVVFADAGPSNLVEGNVVAHNG